ncbi:MAG: Fic family protein [Kofleriaceae bacterium]
MSGRSTDSPLLCSAEEKASLEAVNADLQTDYITSLVVGERSVRELRESHVLQLQALAVQGIYGCGGTYRTARDKIKISDSEHQPAHAADVRNFVTELVDRINADRARGVHEIDCAAYALWRLNWIHPFRGGNGRTSRMIAYLIISMALGNMLPGRPSFPELIADRRDEYIETLRKVDRTLRDRLFDQENLDPQADLSAMVAFLSPLVEAQTEAGVLEGESS